MSALLLRAGRVGCSDAIPFERIRSLFPEWALPSLWPFHANRLVLYVARTLRMEWVRAKTVATAGARLIEVRGIGR